VCVCGSLHANCIIQAVFSVCLSVCIACKFTICVFWSVDVFIENYVNRLQYCLLYYLTSVCFCDCQQGGGAGGGSAQPSQNDEEEQTLYVCPSCNNRYPDLDTLTIHVQECLDQNGADGARN
jgi:hypothetical protein